MEEEDLFDNFLDENASHSTGKAQVLVIEDDITQRIFVERLVQGIGHVVVSVTSGAEAVAAIRNRPFDIVLMDVHLPDIHGVELCQMLQNMAIGDPPVVIAMSSSDDQKTVQACYMTNCCRDYVVKPLQATETRLRIENALIENQLHKTEAARVRALNDKMNLLTQHASAMGNAAGLPNGSRATGNPLTSLGAALQRLQQTIREPTAEQQAILGELHQAKDVLAMHATQVGHLVTSMEALRRFI